MTLKILLPSEVFADKTDVTRIVAETPGGSFGLLPNRLDCVASLAPGILTYQTIADGVVYVAIDAGVLVKAGASVSISVRNAMAGTDLGKLRNAVDREFVNLDAEETHLRSTLAKLESGFMRRFSAFNPGGRT
jgi:F-type H+-transporting ATPase subunit epsilon